MKINEYGVYRDERRIAGATQESVYQSIGLAWVPPELREDRGESTQRKRELCLISSGFGPARQSPYAHQCIRWPRQPA
jgi:hypothetical protein